MAVAEEHKKDVESRPQQPTETKAERDARKLKERSSRKSGISFAEAEDKYFVETRIGAGTYGAVYRAVNRATNEVVAIKKCSDLFSCTENGKRVLREIKLLSFFENDHILTLKDLLVPKSANFQDVFIVTEVMDFDLGQVIYSPQQLAEEHYSYFMFQIMKGLRYIHSAGVIHRDLKPQNILVMENCDCKICDFGLSRSGDDDSMKTTYVVTRWYRAPELILQKEGHGDYTYAIDIWSVGCILAEVIRRKPLFKADNEIGMANQILEVVPLPPAESDFWELPWVKKSNFLRSNRAATAKTSIGKIIQPYIKDPATLAKATDFLEKCLQWDPRQRATCVELLAHPYFSHLTSQGMGVDAGKKFHWEHDGVDIDSATLRASFVEEIRRLNPTADTSHLVRTDSVDSFDD